MYSRWNEIVAEAKKGKGKYQPYAKMKEEYTNMVAWVAARMPKFTKIDVTITIHLAESPLL